MFAVQVVRLFFDGAGGLRAGLFVLLVGFFEVFVAQVFFFEFEGECFALFLQGGEGFFGVKAFGGEALCLFVASGEVGAVLFERGFGGAVVVLLLLPAVVGVLVGLEGGAEGGFQGGNGRQGGKVGGGKVGFFLGLLLLAAGGGAVFGEEGGKQFLQVLTGVGVVGRRGCRADGRVVRRRLLPLLRGFAGWFRFFVVRLPGRGFGFVAPVGRRRALLAGCCFG